MATNLIKSSENHLKFEINKPYQLFKTLTIRIHYFTEKKNGWIKKGKIGKQIIENEDEDKRLKS